MNAVGDQSVALEPEVLSVLIEPFRGVMQKPPSRRTVAEEDISTEIE
jgi:hypothetical protein